MNTEISGYTEFVERAKNFHFDSILTEIIMNRSGLFASIYELKELIKTDIEDAGTADATDQQELLEEVCEKVFDLVFSCSDENKIFEFFLDFCPNYFEFHGKEITEYLCAEGVEAEKVPEFINSQVYHSVFEACFFSLLCAYIEQTKRVDSLTISEFIYLIEDKLITTESAGYVDILKSRERKRERGLSSRLNYDVDNLKQWRIRTLSKNRNFKNRSKWKAVPISAVHELSNVYSVVFRGEDTFKHHRLGSLNKLYSNVREAHKSPQDAEHKSRVNIACDKAIKKIKSISYENYLRQCRFYLNETSKNKQFSGITLYKFEMAHNLHNITEEVNSLLEATSEAEIDNILEGSFILNDIHFPSLYGAFCLIDDGDDMLHCVKTYKVLLADFISSGVLVLDELIEKGCFGDNWYNLFIETINKMAERVLYSSSDIDFSIESDSQLCFETILSVPVSLYYEECDFQNDE